SARQLDHREGTQGNREAPRCDVMTHAEDAAIARGKNDVDGEAHETGVDAGAWRDHEAAAGRHRVAPEQAAPARVGIEGAFERGRQELAGALIPHGMHGIGRSQQRREEMRHALPAWIYSVTRM